MNLVCQAQGGDRLVYHYIPDLFFILRSGSIVSTVLPTYGFWFTVAQAGLEFAILLLHIPRLLITRPVFSLVLFETESFCVVLTVLKLTM